MLRYMKWAFDKVIKIITLLTAIQGGVRTAEAGLLLPNYNQSPLPALPQHFLANPTCSLLESQWSNYHVISNLPNPEQAEVFVFGELHRDEHIYQNGALVLSLSEKQQGIVLLEGLAAEQEVDCASLHLDEQGNLSSVLNQSKKKVRKLFPNSRKLKCYGWENQGLFSEARQIADTTTKNFEDIALRRKKIASVVTKMASDLITITALTEKKQQQEKLKVFKNKLFSDIAELFSTSARKIAETKVTQMLKEISRPTAAARKVITSLLNEINELFLAQMVIERDKHQAVHAEQASSINNFIVKRRNNEGLIPTLTRQRKLKNSIRFFVMTGTGHVLPERAFKGQAEIQDINSSDPQYSLRKYLSTIPSTILVPKDCIKTDNTTAPTAR